MNTPDKPKNGGASNDVAFFTGTAHRDLAESIVEQLGSTLSSEGGIRRFSDGEISVLVDSNVRGKDVFVIQSTPPPADSLLEILLLADALRRSSAERITAVIPYLGYMRQDRRPQASRSPISARVIADMMASSGFSRILTVELHSEQIQGFFSIPVDNIYATPVIVEHIKNKNLDPDKTCVVSPDMGGVVRARALAKKLGCDLAIIDKRRDRANDSEVMNVIGEIAGQHCIMVDDIVDTAGTLCNAAAALKERDALRVEAYCTHAVLSGNAIELIQSSMLDNLVVTDTLPLNESAASCDRIEQISMAGLLAKSIKRITTSESLSTLFK